MTTSTHVHRHNMKNIKFLTPLMVCLLCFNYVSAQDLTSVSLGPTRSGLELSLNPTEALDPTQKAVLGNIANYSLFEIQYANDPERIRGVKLNVFVGTLTCGLECARVTIPLNVALPYSTTYMLKVAGLQLNNKPVNPIKFETKPESSILPTLDADRGRLRVKATIPIEENDKNISVTETQLAISKTGDKVLAVPTTISAVVVDSSSPNEVTLKLKNKLTEGSTHFLSIDTDITDGQGTVIPASGKVKVPGLSTPPSAPAIDLKFSTSAAVNAKPVFDLVATLGLPRPWNLGQSLWYFEPKLSLDLGLGQSKSNNSIILFLPFKHDVFIKGGETGEGIKDLVKGEVAKIPTYYGWSKTPWHRLNAIEFRAGPKFESDRQFARINALGSARFDFKFHRWFASISEVRERLRSDLQKERADQVSLRFGFKLVPYLGLDFGKKVTAEVIENKTKTARAVIQTHPIARIQFGFTNLYQWYVASFPMSLSIDESVTYFWKPERIGSLINNIIDIRIIRGFQHRGKASVDFSFDPAKRYTFNVAYENGRLAPNFEYLNKVSLGFRFLYGSGQ